MMPMHAQTIVYASLLRDEWMLTICLRLQLLCTKTPVALSHRWPAIAEKPYSMLCKALNRGCAAESVQWRKGTHGLPVCNRCQMWAECNHGKPVRQKVMICINCTLMIVLSSALFGTSAFDTFWCLHSCKHQPSCRLAVSACTSRLLLTIQLC